MVKIISGGQSGVDRAALDVALRYNVPCGGWCPRGRRAEDGVIDARYPLKETGAARYPARTAANVDAADATLIVHRGPLTAGTALTWRLATAARKPCLVVDLDAPPAPAEIDAWLAGHDIRVLNIAGPRESRMPGIYRDACAFLERLIVASPR